MRENPHLLVIAGDPSADRHGAALVRALKARKPGVRVTALGGPFLEKEANTFLYPLVGVGGFGFWEPLFKIPQLLKASAKVKEVLAKDPPDLMIPMDYYGFNIRMARLAHQQGIPVTYYISPQVWASRPGRIQKLAEVVDKMLVIFPFEEELYRKAGVTAQYVGHPLLEQLPAPGQPAPVPTIGLLPGSRRGTIKRHLPLLIDTVERLRKKLPEVHYVLFRPEEIEAGFYDEYVRSYPWIEVTSDPQYEARKKLWFAISVSGTAALENMLLGIPMIIMYKLSALTYWIARKIIRVPYVGIPNLLAGKSIVPEVLQQDATPERLCDEATTLLGDAQKRSSIRQALLSLRSTLKEGASARAADEILGMLA